MSSELLKEQAIAAIKTVYDPEIPVDVWELGLIYDLEINENGLAKVKMTLTSPACPVAESLPMEVQEKVMGVDGIKDVDLQVVFTPPWSKERMSEEARFALDMF
jgi:FeS assembly SUF system protein